MGDPRHPSYPAILLSMLPASVTQIDGRSVGSLEAAASAEEPPDKDKTHIDAALQAYRRRQAGFAEHSAAARQTHSSQHRHAEAATAHRMVHALDQEVRRGLGRIVALHYGSSALYQIH
jgi:hypothetical protein